MSPASWLISLSGKLFTMFFIPSKNAFMSPSFSLTADSMNMNLALWAPRGYFDAEIAQFLKTSVVSPC